MRLIVQRPPTHGRVDIVVDETDKEKKEKDDRVGIGGTLHHNLRKKISVMKDRKGRWMK